MPRVVRAVEATDTAETRFGAAFGAAFAAVFGAALGLRPFVAFDVVDAIESANDVAKDSAGFSSSPVAYLGFRPFLAGAFLATDVVDSAKDSAKDSTRDVSAIGAFLAFRVLFAGAFEEVDIVETAKDSPKESATKLNPVSSGGGGRGLLSSFAAPFFVRVVFFAFLLEVDDVLDARFPRVALAFCGCAG